MEIRIIGLFNSIKSLIMSSVRFVISTFSSVEKIAGLSLSKVTASSASKVFLNLFVVWPNSFES